MASLRTGVVEPEVHVDIVFRMMPVASYMDLILLWKIPKTTIFDVLENTAKVIVSELNFLGLPDTVEKFLDLSQSFASSRRAYNYSSGCVGGFDSIAMRIRNSDLPIMPIITRKGTTRILHSRDEIIRTSSHSFPLSLQGQRTILSRFQSHLMIKF